MGERLGGVRGERGKKKKKGSKSNSVRLSQREVLKGLSLVFTFSQLSSGE